MDRWLGKNTTTVTFYETFDVQSALLMKKEYTVEFFFSNTFKNTS